MKGGWGGGGVSYVRKESSLKVKSNTLKKTRAEYSEED